MKTFSSRSYRLLGYGLVSTPFGDRNCWMFELRPKGRSSHFTPSVEFIEEAKWVHNSQVFYLQKEGIVQDPDLRFIEPAILYLDSEP